MKRFNCQSCAILKITLRDKNPNASDLSSSTTFMSDERGIRLIYAPMLYCGVNKHHLFFLWFFNFNILAF